MKRGVRIAAVLLAALLAAACSKYEDEQFVGDWQASVYPPPSFEQELFSGLPRDVTGKVSAMQLAMELDEDKSYLMTADLRITLTKRYGSDNSVLRLNLRYEIRGEWSTAFGNLILRLDKRTVKPLSADAKTIFKKEPSIKKELEEESGIFTPRLGWGVKALTRGEMVLQDSSVGDVRFTPAGG